MGNAKGAVDSDYSGSPLRRPTDEEVAGRDSGVPGNYVGDELPDGTLLFKGPDGRLYYRHFDARHNPVWDRPIPVELAQAIGWRLRSP